VVFRLKDGGVVTYIPGFLPKEQADELWEVCRLDKEGCVIPWAQSMVTVGTKTGLEPRLTAFLGNKDGLKYTYSAKTNVSTKWPPLVEKAKRDIEAAIVEANVLPHACTFNVVLMNWYEHGRHHVGWHSDSETDLVPNSPIASLSLGHPRRFQLRHRQESELGKTKDEIMAKIKAGEEVSAEEQKILEYAVGKNKEMNMELTLRHGDLLVMSGTLQKFWRHRVKQEQKNAVSPRICFTFRAVYDTNLVCEE